MTSVHSLSTQLPSQSTRAATPEVSTGLDVVDALVAKFPVPHPEQVQVILLLCLLLAGAIWMAWMILTRPRAIAGRTVSRSAKKTSGRALGSSSRKQISKERGESLILNALGALWRWLLEDVLSPGTPHSSRRRFKPGEYRSRHILTPNEVEFYNRLVSALPGYVVLSQVAMSALIEPRTEDQGEYMRRRQKICQKYVDFVVCTPGLLEIVCIVELDDITHDEDKDALRDAMLNGAGIEVVRWHSRKKPDREEIARRIRRIDPRTD